MNTQIRDKRPSGVVTKIRRLFVFNFLLVKNVTFKRQLNTTRIHKHQQNYVLATVGLSTDQHP